MKRTCTLGILTREWVSTWWALGLRNLALPGGSHVEILSGVPFDHGRNSVVKKALSRGDTHVFFLDDDIIPPPDAFERLSSHELPVVSGLYWRRKGVITPVAYADSGGSVNPVKNISRSPLEVDAVGAGCLLVETGVFSLVHPPWFEWRSDRSDLPTHERTSEDISFSRKLRAGGVPIVVDTRVKCSHLGWGVAAEGEFRPMGPEFTLPSSEGASLMEGPHGRSRS